VGYLKSDASIDVGIDAGASATLPAAVRAKSGVGIDAKTAAPHEKEAWVHGTFERISERYDLMNDLESFGLHRLWKHALVAAARATGPHAILDVASGTGDIALLLAKAMPQAQVVGLDFSKSMLDVARGRASKLPNGANVSFMQGNALELPFEDGSFDVVTISFGLRNMANYRRSIEEMVRVLRSGGTMLCLEASYPTMPLIKPVFRLYFKHVMPMLAGVVVRKPAEYRWLNDSTEAFLTKRQLVELMGQCGLREVRCRSFALGAAALHSGIK
jgi:demethylmenaquinone methyltransferase/2-methoxy-6-polyprenyl-1,4-benzoquinol methylase